MSLMLHGKKGLALTEDGIFFRRRAEEIVELADRLEQAFVEKNTEVSSLISIGATESVGSRLSAKRIRQFSGKYPLVRFNLYNEMADYIKDRLDKGLIDVGLLLRPADTMRYDYIRLPQEGDLEHTDTVRPSHVRTQFYCAGGNRRPSPDPAAAGVGACRKSICSGQKQCKRQITPT